MKALDELEKEMKGYSKGAGDNTDEDFEGIEAMTDTNWQKNNMMQLTRMLLKLNI